MLSWYCFQIFFSPLVTIPVAPVITGMTKHFMFHICWISIIIVIELLLLLLLLLLLF
jgi:hypothetical protein